MLGIFELGTMDFLLYKFVYKSYIRFINKAEISPISLLLRGKRATFHDYTYHANFGNPLILQYGPTDGYVNVFVLKLQSSTAMKLT